MEAYDDPKNRARILGRDRRAQWLKVDAIIEKVGVSQGMVCVDLGCGAGTLSLPLADKVGNTGKVYAVDTNHDVLQVIKEKHPPDNLVVLQAGAADTGLDASIADCCFMILLLHEVPSEGVVAEAYRLLKAEGKAIILEWRIDFDSPRPPLNERIDRQRMEQLLTEAGFSLIEYTEWSDSHYVITAVKC
ncbi:MAG: class I SAM-dependent methyltransferase [Dehalococcoidales bacterium]|nr:MAG: class I SAM-dependent methyltransferase [Dehalococcoidales bacterium]